MHLNRTSRTHLYSPKTFLQSVVGEPQFRITQELATATSKSRRRTLKLLDVEPCVGACPPTPICVRPWARKRKVSVVGSTQAKMPKLDELKAKADLLRMSRRPHAGELWSLEKGLWDYPAFCTVSRKKLSACVWSALRLGRALNPKP